jgi:hypothetical protein
MSCPMSKVGGWEFLYGTFTYEYNHAATALLGAGGGVGQ